VLLSELLTPERIRIPLVASTKDDLLEELVRVVGETADVANLADVLRAVREREEVLSTGIGNGVAIPHGKSGALSTLAMAAGVTRAPTDFEALDGQPVQLLFLLVGPEAAAGQHVKALSRVSRLLRRDSFRHRLIEAGSAEEFYEILREAELT
jgi:mannitol/fructose-specific phosphotransferase system IIA component (Ntr-type)